jgi:hypothetical protein
MLRANSWVLSDSGEKPDSGGAGAGLALGVWVLALLGDIAENFREKFDNTATRRAKAGLFAAKYRNHWRYLPALLLARALWSRYTGLVSLTSSRKT